MKHQKLKLQCVDATLQQLFDAVVENNSDKIKVVQNANEEPEIRIGFDLVGTSVLLETLLSADDEEIKSIESNTKNDANSTHYRIDSFSLQKDKIKLDLTSPLPVQSVWSDASLFCYNADELRDLIAPIIDESTALLEAFKALDALDKPPFQAMHREALKNRLSTSNSSLYAHLKQRIIESEFSRGFETEDASRKKLFELNWDFLSPDGISKIDAKFEQVISDITFEIELQTQISKIQIFTFDTHFFKEKCSKISPEIFEVLADAGSDFLALLNDVYEHKNLDSTDIKNRVSAIIAKSEPLLGEICSKSVMSWFDIANLYNSNVSLIKLKNLLVEYYYLLRNVSDKLEIHRPKMSTGLENMQLKLSSTIANIRQTIENLTTISNAQCAANQISRYALHAYFSNNDNFHSEIQSDLVRQFSKELLETLKSNPVACLFVLGLLKSDHGYYSQIAKSTQPQLSQICLGDIAIAAAVNKRVIQKL